MIRRKNNINLQLTDVRIKENAWIAKLAARKLHTKSVAIVVGKTIYLHNTRKQDFLRNTSWLKHEMCHVNQFQQQGLLRFIIIYLWESLRKGYYHNKFEVEAREAENL